MDYRWNIYLVNLDPVIGSEQGKMRPVLVISDDDINAILPVINILPITNKVEKSIRMKFYCKESKAILIKIRLCFVIKSAPLIKSV